MSTQYYRWDYVKLLFEMEPDRFHTYLSRLEELGSAHIGTNRWKGAMRVKMLGALDKDKRRYMVTVYGTAAYIVNFLPFAWWPFVRRLDVKASDLPYSDEEVHALRTRLLATDNPYNIVAMNSRDRLKNDKRDAGGRGFSIGSHKSDLRCSMYRRGREGVGLEFQCKDEMLKRLLERHAPAFPQSEHPSTFWLTLKDDIIAAGEQRFARALTSAGLGYARFLGEEQRRSIEAELHDTSDPIIASQGRLDFDSLDEYTSSTDF